MARIGIIGGSGLEDPNILEAAKHIQISTPYGEPSSDILTGTIEGVEIALLSRHGRKHTIPPTQVNNRANMWALKEVGCTHVIATTACGSLREDYQPGDLVILDQFIDFTKHRLSTYYDEFQPGELNHTPMADPFNEEIRKRMVRSAEKMGICFHREGTVVTIEGPRFSTRAESKMYKMWGADVVNMSTAPEVSLANELGLPYASIAMCTDYDCWNSQYEPVSWEEVIKVFNKNVRTVLELILSTINSYALDNPQFFEIR